MIEGARKAAVLHGEPRSPREEVYVKRIMIDASSYGDLKDLSYEWGDLRDTELDGVEAEKNKRKIKKQIIFLLV